MNFILFFLKGVMNFIVSVVLFCFWLLITPINLLFTSICPNNKLHSLSKQYYYKKVRVWLTKDWASRISFTFAHGVTHIFIFIVVALISWKLLDINSSEVKNKFIKVFITSYNGHKINSFNFNWDAGWETDRGYLDGNFSFSYALNSILKDTAHYNFAIRSNFDLKADTAIIDTAIIDDNPRRGIYTLENKTDSFISLDVVIPPPAEVALHILRTKFISDAKLFDDDETPYVNFYLEIHSGEDIEYCNNDNKIYFFLNDEYKNDFGNMPYEIINVKPEPETNCPYIISYTSPEKLKEVFEKGIYISTVNKELKAKNDKKFFLYSVLIGALVSLLFTILIELFSKWRNLNRTLGKDDPYNESEQ